MSFASRIPIEGVVALSGALALATAMGIGRFAFTPMLPLMMQDSGLTLAQGGWLAAVNYAGYLAGAWCASRTRWTSGVLTVVGLVTIVLTTAAMAIPGFMAWLVLRFLAGLASALVFVATSVWCLGLLVRRQQTRLGSWVYTGVGGGMLLSGLYCFVADLMTWQDSLAWLHLSILATILAVPVFNTLTKLRTQTEQMRRQEASQRQDVPPGTRGLVLSYGIMGYGYIVPATFLPVVARSVWHDAPTFGLVWPVFGLVAMLSTLLGGWALQRMRRLSLWACCQLLMALGAVLPGLWLNAITLVVSAILVGGTFMLVTLLGVQEMRARVSWNPGVWVGYLTTAFATGQIAGPALSALMLAHPVWAANALSISMVTAGVALAMSALWLWREAARSPDYVET